MTESLTAQFESARAALAAISREPGAHHTLTDTVLLDLSRLVAEVQRLASTHSALLAGEIYRRSAPELGHSGLAQSAGHRTPEELVRSMTGATAREASTSVRVGRIAAGDTTRPWLSPVGSAVARETLSVAAAESISNGLGSPSAAVPADQLAAAALTLCAEATSLDADRLYRRARELRDELDAEGTAERESSRRDERALTFHRRPDGMSRLSWTMDPETAATVGALYDRATSPRRGGPRFVDARARATSEAILTDPRSTEQLASDVFAEMLRQGAAADSSQLLGSGAPTVRVLVTEHTLRTRAGRGHLEGQTEPVSVATVERLVCSGGVITIPFNETGQPLDVGREQRLHTPRQRIALAVRDGGCRWPGCDRPPSWTEAHHIDHWARDGGRTDVVSGILLCRHHHLLAHNNGWEITLARTQTAWAETASVATASAETASADYLLVPPSSLDPEQRPIPMPTKSRAAREAALTETGAGTGTRAAAPAPGRTSHTFAERQSIGAL